MDVQEWSIELTFRGSEWDEEARSLFFAELWQQYLDNGLLSVMEGEVLADEAHHLGLETESFVVDEGRAPRHRDWIAAKLKAGGKTSAGETVSSAQIIFSTQDTAENAQAWITSWANEKKYVLKMNVEPVPQKDWNAEWKKHFKPLRISPRFMVSPPWETVIEEPTENVLWIEPGAGFGTGTHPTTQLCVAGLEWMSEYRPIAAARRENPFALDFGSGSGILGIALAKLGYQVALVEIDELAHDNARQNGKTNGVEKALHYFHELSQAPLGKNGTALLAVANILKPVLLEYASALIKRMDPQVGGLVLSGLVAEDCSIVQEKFLSEFTARAIFPQFTITQKEEWRCIRFWWSGDDSAP